MSLSADLRDRLRADCSRCAGLCCVAPAFQASADFAIDKPAGTPCPNLGADFRCGIHDRLHPEGFPGCVAYDCFGAGQHVVQVTFGGREWRSEPALASAMFAVFRVVQQLHQAQWYLADVLTRPAAADVHAEARAALAEVERLAEHPAEILGHLDVRAVRRGAGDLLERASRAVRAAAPTPRADHRGADLVGADLRGRDLRGADLRGALLLGADLTGADLRLADLLGADLRGADVSGADLGDALFLTGPQVAATRRGDAATRLPAVVDRPAHWRGTP